jgi:hypothetical protein
MKITVKTLDGEKWWNLLLGDIELIVIMIIMRSKRRRHRKDFPNRTSF